MGKLAVAVVAIIALVVGLVALGVALFVSRGVSPAAESVSLLARTAAPSASGGSAFAPAPTAVAFRAFLKMGAIRGESAETQHKDWIEVLAFSWSGLPPEKVGKAELQPLTFAHAVDKASPPLFSAFVRREHLPEAVLEVCRIEAAKPCFTFVRYKLEDVVVSSLRVEEGVQSTSDKPLEEGSLTYTKFWVEYIPQKADGSPGTSIKEGWDVKNNKRLQ